MLACKKPQHVQIVARCDHGLAIIIEQVGHRRNHLATLVGPTWTVPLTASLPEINNELLEIILIGRFIGSEAKAPEQFARVNCMSPGVIVLVGIRREAKIPGN